MSIMIKSNLIKMDFLQHIAIYVLLTPRVYQKQPLYLYEVEVRSSYILPSSNFTCETDYIAYVVVDMFSIEYNVFQHLLIYHF